MIKHVIKYMCTSASSLYYRRVEMKGENRFVGGSLINLQGDLYTSPSDRPRRSTSFRQLAIREQLFRFYRLQPGDGHLVRLTTHIQQE